jgi:hypothetical protein
LACLRAARAWAKGKATINQVHLASATAYAVASAASATAYAAAYAAYAAALAADAASAASAAAAAATSAASAAYAADAAKSETRRKCARIVRRYYPNVPRF